MRNAVDNTGDPVGLMVTGVWLWDRRRNKLDSYLAGRGRDRSGL